MNKDRLIGFIRVGLVIVIIIMYVSNRTDNQHLESEIEALRADLEETQAKTDSNSSESSNEEADTKSTQISTSNPVDIEDSSELIQKEIETYDTFITDFIDTLMSYDDQEAKNEKLTQMTTESAQTYLKENYYILKDGQEISESDHGEHTEGDFEPLEMDMEIASLDTYYTYTNNKIEVVTLYQMNTEAGDEKFSGNYILKGTLTEVDGDIKFDKITSVVAINDPNAKELYDAY